MAGAGTGLKKGESMRVLESKHRVPKADREAIREMTTELFEKWDRVGGEEPEDLGEDQGAPDMTITRESTEERAWRW